MRPPERFTNPANRRPAFWLWLGLFLATAFHLQAAETAAFSEYDVARLQYVGQVVMAPDGDQIAYTLIVQRNPFLQEDGPAWSELHMVDGNGQSRPFITGPVNISRPEWTPDGRYLSFLARREGDRARSLYRIPVAGGEAQKILEHEAGISDYSWSPDGQQVAFLARTAVSDAVRERREQGFDQVVYEEDWRPVQVWIADIADPAENPRRIDLPGSAADIHWSPDGQHLALTLAPTSLVDDRYMHRRVKIVDVGSGDIVTEIANPGKLGEITWSPDGRYLAMISGLDIHDPEQGRLMVADAQSGEFRNILPGYPGHVADIAWRDNNTLLYIGDEGVHTTLNQIRRDGSGKKTWLAAEGPILNGFSLSDDGKQLALDAESPRHPDEVYSYRLGKNIEWLTHHNSWLDEKQFGAQEVFTWEARDGLELQGILIKPVDYDPGKRYPVILSVHGGPESHDVNGWLTSYSDPGQVAASRGFAVLYPNYRGSTGRGVEFSKLSQGDPTGKEFDDLADAVDALVAGGIADRDRVGITGGSYGGYASAWGATYYSDRFAASVMFVGISDKISKAGTSDIPWELYLVHDPTWPWENWQHYLEASPIYHMDTAKTPLLILHGEEDPRVNPGQSMELYRFLKVRDQAPVRLVMYPGEGHGNRRAASRLDYNLRMMRWMSHYLQGPGGAPPDYHLEYQPRQLHLAE